MENNYGHHFFLIMEEQELHQFLTELNKNYNIAIAEGSRLTAARDENPPKIDLKNIETTDYFGLKVVNLFFTDDRELTHFSSVVSKLKFKMKFMGHDGGWLAVPYYIVSSQNNKKVISAIEESKALSIYHLFKRKKDQLDNYETFIEFEKCLDKLNMSAEEIKDFFIKPHTFIFGERPINQIITNKANGLLNWLKARLGEGDPF